MKKNLLYIGLVVLALAVPSCKDYLTEPEPGVSQLSDYFTSKEAAVANVTACYVPLMWEYNNTYYSEWFIGDIVSDDALKGGQNTNDMSAAYDMENWKTISTNELLLDYYRAQYQGIGRCNLSLKYVGEMKTDTAFNQSLQNRLLGEAYFLRAYYYFRLLRVFGGVPLSTEVLDSEDKWQMDRASIETMFSQIISDLEQANAKLWPSSRMNNSNSDADLPDLGRATKGSAQAMLLKTYLYMASPYWNKLLPQDAKAYAQLAKQWGDSIIQSKEYMLCPNYRDNFTLAGENGVESVFEIQYSEQPWGDYGEGNGFTCGSFTQILMRSRNSNIGGGWGFDHPTHNLYNEFEAADTIRRSTAILVPTSFQNENEETYLGSAMLNRKYGMYDESKDNGGGFGQWGLHASRGPLNNKQIRYADVLLMYAEVCLILGEEPAARTYINEVRQRVSLPTTDDQYSITLNGKVIAEPTTEQLLRHERRMELAMEGHRWFDLVRWGNTKAHMDAYAETDPTAKTQMATFVEGKHELFPIPYDEIILNPMSQNNGY